VYLLERRSGQIPLEWRLRIGSTQAFDSTLRSNTLQSEAEVVTS
jgi:hypothetical protein